MNTRTFALVALLMPLAAGAAEPPATGGNTPGNDQNSHQNNDQNSDQNKARLMIASDAYSQCTAYFEMVGQSLEAAGKNDLAQQASSKASQSDYIAKTLAEEMYAATISNKTLLKATVNNFLDKNHQTAVRHFNSIRGDKEKIQQVSRQYQLQCSAALSDPGRFSDMILESLKANEKKAGESSAAPSQGK